MSRSRRPSRRRNRRKKPTYVRKGISPGRAKRLVYDGHYKKTRGGLTREDITLNKYGKAVSKKKLAQGKRLQRRYPYESNDEFMTNVGQIEQIKGRRGGYVSYEPGKAPRPTPMRRRPRSRSRSRSRSRQQSRPRGRPRGSRSRPRPLAPVRRSSRIAARIQ